MHDLNKLIRVRPETAEPSCYLADDSLMAIDKTRKPPKTTENLIRIQNFLLNQTIHFTVSIKFIYLVNIAEMQVLRLVDVVPISACLCSKPLRYIKH